MTDPLTEEARAFYGTTDDAAFGEIDSPNLETVFTWMAAFARSMLEKSCKAVCENCENGVPVRRETADDNNYWVHEVERGAYWNSTTMSDYPPCAAAPIRKLMEARNG